MRTSGNDEFGFGDFEDEDFSGGATGYSENLTDNHTPQAPFETAESAQGTQPTGIPNEPVQPNMGDYLPTPQAPAPALSGIGDTDPKKERMKGVGLTILLLLAGYGAYRFFQDRR